MPITDHELILASHRLPIEARRVRDGLEIRSSPGGLARALNDLLQRNHGTWIGYPGIEGRFELDEDTTQRFPYGLVPIQMSGKEMENHYRGFSNQILWPLFHDLHPYCDFEPTFWEVYKTVNQRYTDTITNSGDEETLVWVHDYHLMMVPRMLRDAGDDRRLGFFLHIPFPPVELMQRLPWHPELLDSLVQSDLVGFQTSRDLEHFVDCVTGLLGPVHIERGDSRVHIETPGSDLTAAVFPISIDAQALERQSAGEDVERRYQQAKRAIGEEQTCIVGVERLDYTKGVPERLRAFGQALDRYPDLHGKVTLLQHINPSREEITLYQELKEEVERLVGHINGVYGTMEWVPVRYSYGQLDFQDVLSLYRLGDVALITPLRDGMNLVCKEYCIANREGDGALILSQFAGAAEQLGEHAILVNPHDIDQMAWAIHRACTMDKDERRRRMDALRGLIQAHDVHAWAQGFLENLVRPSTTSTHLSTRTLGNESAGLAGIRRHPGPR